MPRPLFGGQKAVAKFRHASAAVMPAAFGAHYAYASRRRLSTRARLYHAHICDGFCRYSTLLRLKMPCHAELAIDGPRHAATARRNIGPISPCREQPDAAARRRPSIGYMHAVVTSVGRQYTDIQWAAAPSVSATTPADQHRQATRRAGGFLASRTQTACQRYWPSSHGRR